MLKIMRILIAGYDKIQSLSKKPPKGIQSEDIQSEYIYDIPKYDSDDSIANISTGKYEISDFLKFWLMWLAVVYIWYMAYGIVDTIYLIILWYVLSIAVESYIWRLVSKWVSRSMGIFLSYFSLLSFLVLGILVVIPFFAEQVSDLMQIFIQYFTIIQNSINKLWVVWYVNSIDIPYYMKQYVETFINNPKYINNIQDLLKNSLDSIVKQWSQYVGNAWVLLYNTVKWLWSVLFQIWLAFTTAILFSIDQENILRYINIKTKSQDFSNKLKEIYTKIGYWLKSQFILCLMIFVTVYIWLWAIELFGISIPNKLSLALISWLTEIIPYIWPFLGSIPWVLVGTISNWRIWFISVAIMYFLVQWTENNIFIPALMNKALWVSPVLIFVCVLIGGMSMWMVGIILWIPIAIIISVMSE